MRRVMRSLGEDQAGITGLETAIILIAFVVVAAVFAYTVLSAGLFSTQKSQESVYTSLKKTQSTLEQVGALIAYDEDDNEYVDKLEFTVRLALDGEPIDFTPNDGSTAGQHRVIVNYQDENQWKSDLKWSLTRLGSADGDNLLEQDETFVVTVPNLESGTTNGLNPDLGRKTQFTLQVKTPGGATLIMERTTPKHIDKVMNLN